MHTETLVLTVGVQLDPDGAVKVLVNGRDRTALLFPHGFPDIEGPEPYG